MRHAFSTEQEYTVEAILDSKITKTKKGNLEKYFLIKWDGCDEQSWEPTKNLTGCEEMLNAYMNRLSPITSPTSSDTEGDTSDGRRSITDAGAAYFEDACSRPGVLPCRLEAHAAEKARSEPTHATEEWEEVLGAQDKADQVLDL